MLLFSAPFLTAPFQEGYFHSVRHSKNVSINETMYGARKPSNMNINANAQNNWKKN
jgi:hypothetical protein